jgi:hypothetical protein
MRLLASLVLWATVSSGADLPYFSVLSEDKGSWPDILDAIGMQERPVSLAHVFVARGGTPASVEWNARIEGGAILIVEGDSSLGAMFGFQPGKDHVRVGNLADVHNPKLPIIWENSVELPIFEVPEGARVFARERWMGAPIIAGLRRGAGAVLWVAVSPGAHGYERFPYLLAALCDLGLEIPFRSAGLWAFFDSAYRSRVDLDYFAARWRRAGISALHVAAWHFYEPGADTDAYLKKLIEACHRQGILVYAWLELPHVSDKFWNDHPEWRERTGLLQDAELDWRKLMNLSNRECFRTVSAGVRELIGRFDWDGVNLAELYFDSLEGIGNPSRFTPMDADIRAEFRVTKGFDPIELFGKRKDSTSRRVFLDFRSELAGRIQEQWIDVLESVRHGRPDLDLVLTQVDDRFDSTMRDAIGVDSRRLLPLTDRHGFTFLIEDPATVWHLGPQRYQAIAEAYQGLSRHPERLAIDLNIVDRYQNVYPTKQQTGTELFQLVHQAAVSFRRLALYFENSLLTPDLPLLPSAAAVVARIDRVNSQILVESPAGVGVPWRGAALLDGQYWPAADDHTVWVPPGKHTLEAALRRPGPRLLWLNGELKTARLVDPTKIEFHYDSQARAIAVLDRPVNHVEIDGAPAGLASIGPVSLFLPSGQHVVVVGTE